MARFFNDFESKCFNAADSLPLNDTVGRDRAYLLITLSRKFRKTLEYYVQTGEFAKEQIDELLSARKERKSFLGGMFG